MQTHRVLRDGARFVLQYIRSNRLRTFLSLLGVTIGIFTIIAIFIVFDSLQSYLDKSLSALGSRAVYVQKWAWGGGPDYPWWIIRTFPEPDYKDYQALQNKMRYAEFVSMSVFTSGPIKFGDSEIEKGNIGAFTQHGDYFLNLEIKEGRHFSSNDYNDGQSVCLVGSKLSETLSPLRSPLNEHIEIMGRRFRIIGIIKEQGESFANSSPDEMAIIPLLALRKMINLRYSSTSISVEPKAGVTTEELKSDIRRVLRAHRRLPPGKIDNFSINQVDSMKEEMNRVFGVINLAGWVIGGFSILVGGFGIANIMFVSVKERTKIIGIQKALGAKNWFILVQFLFESTILSLLGGVLGLLLLALLAMAASTVTPFPIFLSLKNIIIGLSISGVIGLLSGLIPARSAAHLDPVVAIGTTI